MEIAIDKHSGGEGRDCGGDGEYKECDEPGPFLFACAVEFDPRNDCDRERPADEKVADDHTVALSIITSAKGNPFLLSVAIVAMSSIRAKVVRPCRLSKHR